MPAKLTLEAMNAMTPIITLPKADPDIVCDEPGCSRLADFLTAGGVDEHGVVFTVGYCSGHLPGDENHCQKHMPCVVIDSARGRG